MNITLTLIKFLVNFKDKDALILFFKLVNDFIKELKLDDENEKIAFNFREDIKSLHLNLNNRLVLGIKNNSTFSFMSNVVDTESLKSKVNFIKHNVFKSPIPEATLNYLAFEQLNEHQDMIKPLWLKSCKECIPAWIKSPHKHLHQSLLYQLAIDPDMLKSILQLDSPQRMLLWSYKNLIREKGIEKETYKWELIQKLKGRPNLDASNFADEIKELYPPANNLVYQMVRATSNRMAQQKPEEYRACLHRLFDEKLSLSERITYFLDESKALYASTEGKNASHHDERTASAYLTFKYPDKYTFYKNSFYSDYCDYMGIQAKMAGEKYAHYLELVRDLANNYIVKDEELLGLVENSLPKQDYEADTNKLLLAQDVLYEMFDTYTPSRNYWVFQANPKYYDTEAALNAEAIKSWRVNQYTNDIKLDDKVILWIAGDKAGVYALASVDSNVHKIKQEPIETQFYEENEENEEIDGVKLTVEYNLVNHPLLKEEVLNHPVLKELNQGMQGTNFKATEEQYYAILDWLNFTSSNLPNEKSKSFKSKTTVKELNQILFGPPGTGKTYNTINKAIEIIHPDFDLNQKRSIVKAAYQRLVDAGQIVFTTFHQNMSYEDFIEGIKPVINDEVLDGELHYTIEEGIFKSMCKAAQTPNQVSVNGAIEPKPNFVLIIDEINRGNVSSIFGELITLIEKDKRSGGKEALEATLPYSKESFAVPGNVYIVGTMNTADRSIEALDTALRRRFAFIEMPPRSELIKSKGASLELTDGKIDEIDVVKLLDTINARLEKLIDKDHKIGHSYFMHINTKTELIGVFADKVIPLLEEYFFGDAGKIGLVLGNSFVTKVNSDDFEFASFDGYNNQVQDLKERPVYCIRPINEWDFVSIYTPAN